MSEQYCILSLRGIAIRPRGNLATPTPDELARAARIDSTSVGDPERGMASGLAAFQRFIDGHDRVLGDEGGRGHAVAAGDHRLDDVGMVVDSPGDLHVPLVFFDHGRNGIGRG
ncbi:hypothetical protein [Agromyces sp. SYSU T00266]|uniref:hypothetical protein n=1 Tax=Agromyces zhanjiangensis TaxID=3158562 RepID=UPI003391F780